MKLKKTPLYEKHVSAGGRLIEFGGWEMPVQYEGIIPEHLAVREKAGLFDVSHMGEVDVTGNEAEAFVQYLVTNNVKTLEDRQVLYAMMCQEDGGVVDDLLVYKFSDNHFYLVINAANIEKDYNWIKEVSESFDVQVKNISESVAEVALQGPAAEPILQSFASFNLSEEVPFFFCKRDVDIDGVSCLISRTGYTGEDGFEIYASPEEIGKVWDKLFEVGEAYGLKPAGLGARDTLRFEACLPLYGHEISDSITPLEAGLSIFVKLDTDDFIGKEALRIQKENGIPRKLVGFEIEKGVAREGCKIVKEGREIGHVTTGYHSPTLGKSVGLALIERSHADMGEQIDIQIRKKVRTGTIISKRFYKKNYKK